ncbi:ABC transporter ATP-binding protein [Nocardia asteroides]|uniref:ABC transporter ATP-binding protein n=1 Tax=Nocardia asteroides TaxID=1824 RepID=UPI001E2847B2|nr:ABC transporter ATP-binding protein [Nocardia asteroides]UGT62237.1 ABC transporter ATP-binding protein [Nocardia asteroides]
MGTLAVRIADGHKNYAGTPVLRGLDLAVPAGETLAVLGVSGSGKSTLLRVLAGLDRLDAGSIDWDGAGTPPATGTVFQQPLLMPWLTVRDNILFGGRFTRHRDGFDAGHALGLLARFGLGDLAGRRPDQLSGGQAQRIAVIRAAAVRPRLLLLDEPFSALDPAVRADLQDWLRELVAELSCTTVLVTHDVDEALRLADRIVLIGPGAAVREDVRLTGADPVAVRERIVAGYRETVVPA